MKEKHGWVEMRHARVFSARKIIPWAVSMNIANPDKPFLETLQSQVRAKHRASAAFLLPWLLPLQCSLPCPFREFSTHASTCTNPLSYPATPYCIESHCLNGIEEFRASVRLISNPDAEFAHGPQAGCNH